MLIRKVVITGGPCAGKTTAMSWIQNHFTRMGYTVLFIPETATELISGGVCPWTCGTNLDYQKCQLKLQMTKEQLFEQAARTMPQEKILIVCDRGIMDNKAYMTEEEFAEAVRYIGSDVVSLRDQYDAVFHLVTAAKGAEEFYTFENNAARYESVEQAVDLDDRLLASWTGHPHLRVIDNSTDFMEKMQRLINEMIRFLGETNPIASKRKFLIEYPDLEWLDSNKMARKLESVEVYLQKTLDEEHLAHKRGENGHYFCYESVRKPLSDRKFLEMERRITEDEYNDLIREADPERAVIRKTRYYLAYEKQYFEIDIYPNWEDHAIAEIEVANEDDEIRFPEEIHVIREITGEPEYRKSSLSYSEAAE
ncbi:MAG: AAA family ATPase [Solobacterium sp.]|nr:AAA family ATPase [Solobacterium sp.]